MLSSGFSSVSNQESVSRNDDSESSSDEDEPLDLNINQDKSSLEEIKEVSEENVSKRLDLTPKFSREGEECFGSSNNQSQTEEKSKSMSKSGDFDHPSGKKIALLCLDRCRARSRTNLET